MLSDCTPEPPGGVPLPAEKRCGRCRAVLPLLAFCKNRRSRDGLNNRCRACMKAIRAALYRANPEIVKARVRTWKAAQRQKRQAERENRPEPASAVCTRCQRELPIGQFGERFAGRKNTGKRKRHTWCRRCLKAYKAAGHKRMKGIPEPTVLFKLCGSCGTTKPAAEFDLARATGDHLSAVCVACRQREEDRQRVSKYRSSPKGKLARRENHRRRQAAKHAPDAERVDYAAILARDGYVCHICLGAVAPDEMHFDHVIPVTRGGPHRADNIRVSHRLCNLKKSNKLL